MYRFPSTTYVHKEIKIQDLFKRMVVDSGFRKKCSGIKSVILENVLSPKRMGIGSDELKELYVFVIDTDAEVPDEFFLKLDRLINPSIQTLYCIQNGTLVRYLTAFRCKGNANPLSRYIRTDWMTHSIDEEIPIVDTLDNIYLMILSSFKKYPAFHGESISAYNIRMERLEKLDALIEKQQKLVDSEVQSKKRIELNASLKILKKEKEDLLNEREIAYGKIAKDIEEYRR